jgi:hypothetical protein
MSNKKYKLLDVEDRPVALLAEDLVHRAFLWQETDLEWQETPDLVGKALLDGIALSEDAFKKEFPTADLSLLFD